MLIGLAGGRSDAAKKACTLLKDVVCEPGPLAQPGTKKPRRGLGTTGGAHALSVKRPLAGPHKVKSRSEGVVSAWLQKTTVCLSRYERRQGPRGCRSCGRALFISSNAVRAIHSPSRSWMPLRSVTLAPPRTREVPRVVEQTSKGPIHPPPNRGSPTSAPVNFSADLGGLAPPSESAHRIARAIRPDQMSSLH